MNLILIAIVSIVNSLFLIVAFLLGLGFGINNARLLKKGAHKKIFSNFISEDYEDEFSDDKEDEKVSKIMSNIDNYSGNGEGQKNIDDF